MTLVGKSNISLFLVCFICWSCGKETTNYNRIGGTAQGTTFSITYLPTSNTSFEAEVDSIFKEIDQSLSLWDSTSLITKFNESATGIAVDSHFLKVFRRSKVIYQTSNGAFDPTVGPLVQAWGFIRKNNKPLPDELTIKKLLLRKGMDAVGETAQGLLYKSKADVALDFNAIAQGYTVDVMADFLEKKQIQHYLIEIGGEVRTKGLNSQNKPWQVGIEKPSFNSTTDKNEIQVVIGLSGQSLATSGNYRKFIEKEGKKYAHTIDPKTGKPVEHNVLSVSVVSPKCMDADAWATAFMVMNQKESLKLADSLGLAIQIISADEKGFGITTNARFDALIVK